MKCPSCGAEIPDNNESCPICKNQIKDTSNLNYDDSDEMYDDITKHNKIVKIAGISIICIACFSVGLLIGLNSKTVNTINNNTTVSDNNITTESINTDNTVSTPTTPTEPIIKTFSAGQYIVGTDIPEGTYNIKWLSGSGDVLGAVDEMFGADEDSIKSYNNAYLSNGDKIKITGTLIVTFTNE